MPFSRAWIEEMLLSQVEAGVLEMGVREDGEVTYFMHADWRNREEETLSITKETMLRRFSEGRCTALDMTEEDIRFG